MRFYWIKTNAFVKWLFPKYIWGLSPAPRKVYLTFDDGPVPEATPWILDLLKKYNAKATFFCIGENALANPKLLKRIINEGHAIGNHTYNHVNGWQTKNSDYLQNINACANTLQEIANIDTKLFRPPYGKITSAQATKVLKKGYKIIMWDVLSADFDPTITPQQCANNVLQNIEPGSIVIFHDSLKAFKNLEYALPATLEYVQQKGYACEVLN